MLVETAARVAMRFFALWVLFFFYLKGDRLIARISFIGFKWLKSRWPSCIYNIPPAVRSAVNGLVLVGPLLAGFGQHLPDRPRLATERRICFCAWIHRAGTGGLHVAPRLIKGSTVLPFLAILFGIFGGIAAMGLLGLIIGPVILVLFMVLLREA